MDRHHADDEAAQLADLAGLAIAVAALIPSRLVRGGPTLCPVRRVTGLPCPTCGITRSWNAAARLQLRASLGYHPLGPVTFAAGLAAATGLFERDLHTDRFSPATRRVAASVVIAAWLSAWVMRVIRAKR